MKKDTKKEAEYEKRATDQTKRCELCTYYIAHAMSCEKVLGFIAAKAWCHHFRRKT